MHPLQHLFDNNLAWVDRIRRRQPDFFARLAHQQAPKYLWIGCSDSRVSANQIVDLPPGEVFVHRNIANVVAHTDLNCLSVIQYAIDVLQIRHIIVCGHYGCGGVRAAMDPREHGLIDNWLRHVEDVAHLNADSLRGLEAEQKLDRLCELNVIEQVKNVCDTTIVVRAWNGGMPLSVHGWIYNIGNGILKDLDISISSLSERRRKP